MNKNMMTAANPVKPKAKCLCTGYYIGKTYIL